MNTAKFEVEIVSPPTDKIAFIKVLRMVAELELRQASSLASFIETSGSAILAAGIDQPIAEHIAGILREAGVNVTVRESTSNAPMMCFPDVNKKYKGGRLFGIHEDKT